MRLLVRGLALLLLGAGVAPAQTEHTITGIFRIPGEIRDGYTVWIVDGPMIRKAIYPEFLFGGNDQRYRFIPEGEIWVDNAITADEYEYTVVHELREQHLMATWGLTYDAAHDSALAAEHALRLADRAAARRHEHALAKVSPTDCDGLKELADLPDSVRLENIYRVPIGSRDGLSIWVVDGAAVRRDIFPDFGLSGNDVAYHYIPGGEIWIDGEISVEELEFSIQLELTERNLMMTGLGYDSAYTQALDKVADLRRRADSAAASHAGILVPYPPDRDVGTGTR